MRVLIFLLLAASVWGVEVQEGEIMKNLERLKESGVLSGERLTEIRRFKKDLEGIEEKALERAGEWRIEIEKKGNGWIAKTESRTVYIFMSSSVPLEVWWRYAHYLLDRNIHGVFILRGCIGGCRYIRPTLEFIRRFLTEDGKNEEGLPVEVQIDPLKFRDYGVKVVPCVAVEGRKKLSCGDWSLEYHLGRLGR